jgi:hypothetical protein
MAGLVTAIHALAENALLARRNAFCRTLRSPNGQKSWRSIIGMINLGWGRINRATGTHLLGEGDS